MSVTYQHILAARQRIAGFLNPTPAMRYPGLDALFGCDLWVKHENHNPTGAFKVRGGLNLAASLPEAERRRGVVAASTGNHGQSVAYGAKMHRIPATIYVPEGANADKVRAIRDLGAEIVHYGENYESCRQQAEAQAKADGRRFVSGGNEPMLIAGVGTYANELMQTVPDLDLLYVPVGGGSGACGCCIAGHAVNPRLEVVGVQSAHANAVLQSWESGEFVRTESANTFAEGLATLAPFELTLDILRRELNRFEEVTDDALFEAVRRLFEFTHNLAEGAGAAAFAAAWRDRDRLQGKKVAVVLSGCNITSTQLMQVFQQEESIA